MKEEFTEKKLQEKANTVFADFPEQEQVYATYDGNIFLVKNHAEMHAAGTRVLTIDRPRPFKEIEQAGDDQKTKQKKQDQSEQKNWLNKIIK